MTQPRRHIAGQVVHISRRCFQRSFFLRPDTTINQVIAYETARASTRHGQAIHAYVGMSNHIHQISTDTVGERSGYMRDAMREISRARNLHLKRRDRMWDGRPFGDTVLLDRDAIERALVYTWMNPVKAGLVRRAEEWPGFKILPRHWGIPMKIKRPNARYYGKSAPKVVEFTPMPPPGYDDMSLEEVREHFETLLREAEDEVLKRRKGKRVMGRTRICSTNPLACPRTKAPMRTLRPRFSTLNGELMATAQTLYREFQDSYQRERARWLKGKRVTFPCGTVQLRRCAPVRCGPVSADEPGLVAIKLG